jgi:putative transposon-encoded protein
MPHNNLILERAIYGSTYSTYMNNKRDITINKVEGRPSKFGTGGAHICVPKEWLKSKKTLVVIPKETYEELQSGG